MAQPSDPIVSTTLQVEGVRSEADARNARQALFDVFARLGLGQATFEVTGTDAADLILKHKASVVPDKAAIAAALADAGDFRLVD